MSRPSKKATLLFFNQANQNERYQMTCLFYSILHHMTQHQYTHARTHADTYTNKALLAKEKWRPFMRRALEIKTSGGRPSMWQFIKEKKTRGKKNPIRMPPNIYHVYQLHLDFFFSLFSPPSLLSLFSCSFFYSSFSSADCKPTKFIVI